MEIIVEIGTEEQKRLIRQELETISLAVDQLPEKLNIDKLIVPKDFDKTVNEIECTNNYESIRDHQTMAKIAYGKNGVSLIFSPSLYTANFDDLCRGLFYFHELLHAVHKLNFSDPKDMSRSQAQAFYNLRILLDEYSADRRTLEIIDKVFPQKSILFKKLMRTNVGGFVRFYDSIKKYEELKRMISTFRLNRDINAFCQQAEKFYNGVALAIIHSYSHIDHSAFLKKYDRFAKRSKFVNEKTLRLLDFIRKKYLERDWDLKDGIELMRDFLTNFGARLEDTAEGLYCHVLDV